MKKISYKEAGVDIQKAEEFVKFIKKHSLNIAGAFGSVFELKKIISKYKAPVLVSSTDGVGTKLLIAQKLNIHNTVGIDLVAMNVNDIICSGAKPLFFMDYIACGRLNKKVLKEIMKGIIKGVKESGAILIGGETAEMPDMYEKEKYDLAGFASGIVEKEKIITGKNIKEGDIVLGLASSGIHSNGYSLVRKIFTEKEIKKYSRELLKPTKIYVKVILDTVKKFGEDIKGIAHNTGGAWYNKITKILPPQTAYYIYNKSWTIPEIFYMIKKKGNIDWQEMFSTFNMGIGMVIVVSKENHKKIFNFLKKREKVFIIGEIIKSRKEKIIFDSPFSDKLW